MSIRPRSAWHPAPSQGFARTLDPSQVTGVVLHYPGNAGTIGAVSADRVALLLRSYRRYHIVYRGWPDIGYCYAVDQAGRAWTAAGDKVAAHSATALDKLANHTNLGILLVVGNNEPLSPALVATLRELIATKRRTFTRINRVRGHSQVTGASTGCPGNAARHLIATGNLLGPLPDPTPPTKDETDMPKLTDSVPLTGVAADTLNGPSITYERATAYAAAGGFAAIHALPRIEKLLGDILTELRKNNR